MLHQYTHIKTNEHLININLNDKTSSRTVYLVDDDRDDRLFGFNQLRKSDRIRDIKTLDCADALFEKLDNTGFYKCMSYAEENKPVILLDIHMPNVNGIELLEKIRSHPITSNFTVILLTSDLSCENIYDAYRLDANGYLEKPFCVNEFHKILEKIDSGSDTIEFSKSVKLN